MKQDPRAQAIARLMDALASSSAAEINHLADTVLSIAAWNARPREARIMKPAATSEMIGDIVRLLPAFKDSFLSGLRDRLTEYNDEARHLRAAPPVLRLADLAGKRGQGGQAG